MGQPVEFAQVRAMVQEGVDELDHGDVIDADTFFDDWNAELDELERRLGQERE